MSRGFCSLHLKVPRFIPATTEDGEWGDVCEDCAEEIAAARASGRLLKGCDINGNPLDPRDHWYGNPRKGA